MPRYFFNTRIADELISDPEGEELRDPDRAWEIARAMIRELANRFRPAALWGDAKRPAVAWRILPDEF